MKTLFGLLRFITASLFAGATFMCAILAGLTLYSAPYQPRIESVLDLKLQTPLRIFSADGLLIGEFGETRRQPLPYKELPDLFVKAVISAEDERFFTHAGVDANGLLRAAYELAKTGRIQSGGSTITMQLARNFFLSSEKSFVRKLNEILLSVQLERTLSKEQIFELYANKIFLGNRAYGVQSAAYIYYGKPLNELTIAQWAMLAGLPKAPSKYNPIVNPERAQIRRNWILGRMLKLGFIDQAQYDASIKEVEVARYHGLKTDMDAPYIAEMARQFAIEKFGEEAYTKGYSIHTTVRSDMQKAAQEAVWKGVLEYDYRHGYRGAEKHLTPIEGMETRAYYLAELQHNHTNIGDLIPAVILKVENKRLTLLLRDNTERELAWSDSVQKRLRPYQNEDYFGKAPNNFSQVFRIGDVIRVRKLDEDALELDQVPKAQGSLVSLDSNTGALIALAGGTDFRISKFNRATQAYRQPGSAFKPFIYLAALERNMTPATLINDAPIVFQEAGMKEAWKPENASSKYLGPVRMRRALTSSINTVSIRLLQTIGVRTFIRGLDRFGFDNEKFSPNLSLALGTHGITPLELTEGLTAFANGGYRVEPYFVDRIEDANGQVVYQPVIYKVCETCEETAADPESPILPAKRIIDAQNAYIMDDMLKDVVRFGTGRQALTLNRTDIAGKTGTTNGPTDVWFTGYSPAVTTTAWIGFDDNSKVGKKEYGGTAALPMWIRFMEYALKEQPVVERAMPAGLTVARIDPDTGQRLGAGRSDGIFELFRGNPNVVSTPAASTTANSSDAYEDYSAPAGSQTQSIELPAEETDWDAEELF